MGLVFVVVVVLVLVFSYGIRRKSRSFFVAVYEDMVGVIAVVV